MSDQTATAAVPEEAQAVIEKARGFWAKFNKLIIYGGSAIILLGGGWLAYKNFVLVPKMEKAADAIFPAEQIFDKMTQTGFSKDSINLVLNGGNGITGLLKVAEKFDGTPAGDRAHYMAGACYLHNKEFEKAIKHLKGFSTDANQVQAAAYIMLGDASAELKKNEDALSYYKKASTVNSKDEFMTPEALYKLGGFAESIGKTEEAIAAYKKIKESFPKSARSGDMEKFLARLGVTE